MTRAAVGCAVLSLVACGDVPTEDTASSESSVVSVCSGTDEFDSRTAVAFANQQALQNSEWLCAEFVSRSLAAGDAVPNMLPFAGDVYGSYSFCGKTYNLKVTSSKSSIALGLGPILGVEDYLIATGRWTKLSSTSGADVRAGDVVFIPGENCGCIHYGHVMFGVGDGIVDAHNSAAKQVSVVGWAIDAIYRRDAQSCASVSQVHTWPLLASLNVTLWGGCGLYHLTATGPSNDSISLDNSLVKVSANLSSGGTATTSSIDDDVTGQLNVCATGPDYRNQLVTNCTGWNTP